MSLRINNITEISSSIREGKETCKSIVERYLNSIKTKNTTLNAFSDVYEEDAITLAEQRDEEIKNGINRGPLHGVPIGVKDLFLVKDRRTARGSVAFSNFIPEESAPIVERIEEAGAIILGKTTTTEMGWSGSSVSEYYGPTRNPWNPALSSGGSSSGSAVALASGMVPVTIGSDGGGSVRIPASFCGVFAMKGSLARIPTYPWSATEMLSHAGPMTLTANDSAVMFDVLKGPDSRDHQALPAELYSYQDIYSDTKNMRIAYAPTLFETDIDADVSRCVEAGIGRIKDVFGVKVEKLCLDWEDPIRIFEVLWVAGRGIVYGGQAGKATNEFGAGFSKLVRASSNFSLADYLDAMKARAVYSAKIHRFFENYDLLLMPTIPILPFAAEQEAPDNLLSNSEILPWTGWTPFTYPFNISGNPAASIPAGLSNNGLPVGLQVVGRRHDDARVLAFCRDIEENAEFSVFNRINTDLVDAKISEPYETYN